MDKLAAGDQYGCCACKKNGKDSAAMVLNPSRTQAALCLNPYTTGSRLMLALGSRTLICLGEIPNFFLN